MEWWWAYLAIGAAVGFLAGLLGIGGGMVMVPMLVFVFTAKGFPAAHMMHLSLATSMATIVFTSLASVRAHDRHQAVDWTVARAMAPGIVVGALAAMNDERLSKPGRPTDSTGRPIPAQPEIERMPAPRP